MAYIRCESCGSKALSAASQCPRCAVPFDLTDTRGLRAPLKKCGGCGIMHRQDRSCHWCGDRSVPAWRSVKVLRSAAAVAIMALGGVGAYGYRAPLRETASLIVARALAPAAPRTEGASVNSPVTTPVQSPALAQIAAAPAANTEALQSADPTTTASAFDSTTLIASAADSIRWIPAVARTWVNVRNDASRGGNVVGVINPASRAMLGTTRAGWRQVKSTEVTGWVDPRLFEPDSLRTRG